MLPRNMRTGGSDLPGVESNEVPLIGYRPLPPDRGTPSSQSGRGSGSDELDASQVSVFSSASTEHIHHFVTWARYTGWDEVVAFLTSLFAVVIFVPPARFIRFSWRGDTFYLSRLPSADTANSISRQSSVKPHKLRRTTRFSWINSRCGRLVFSKKPWGKRVIVNQTEREREREGEMKMTYIYFFSVRATQTLLFSINWVNSTSYSDEN